MMDASAAATLLTQSQDRQASAALVQAKALGQKGKPMNEKQMDTVAKDFEAMFIAQMMGNMFGESTMSLFGDANSQEIYKELMMDAYSKAIVNSGGIGIASYVKTELLSLQEVKS